MLCRAELFGVSWPMFVIRLSTPICEKTRPRGKRKNFQRRQLWKRKNASKYLIWFGVIFHSSFRHGPQIYANVTNEIKMFILGLLNDQFLAIFFSNITRFDGQKNISRVEDSLWKYFLAPEILQGRKPLVACQLCIEKATDLVGEMSMRQHGARWGYWWTHAMRKP